MLCDLDPARDPVALCAAGHVDCVAKETISWHSQANDSCNHLSTVDTDTHLREGGRERGGEGRKGGREGGRERRGREERRDRGKDMEKGKRYTGD